MICFNLEWLFQVVSNTRATCWARFSRFSLVLMADEFKLEKPLVSDVMNSFSSSLSLLIDLVLMLILVSMILTSIISVM